jgi:hypothetical protein
MKRTFLFVIIIVIAALLFGAWKAFDGIYFKKGNQSTIKCHYMAYPCGDCYPQWQIDSNYAAENGLKELIKKDIYINRNGQAVEGLISDSTSKCMICYDFYFTGSMKKTLSGKFKFDTDNFKMELRFKGCCN